MAMKELAEILLKAESVVAVTGAGVSAESGVPTFRGPDGYWRSHRAEELATTEAFQRNPQLVWEWYNERRLAIAAKEPNPAHRILAGWEKRLPGFHLITQNVDGLHQRAGSRNVIALHGDIWEMRCGTENVTMRNEETPLRVIPPRCQRCGALLRPNVVWFGEALPQAALHRAEKLAETCDALLVIGTSAIVYPAAALPMLAKRRGAVVIEINPDETPLSAQADFRLRGKAGEILSAIDRAIHARSPRCARQEPAKVVGQRRKT